MMQVEWHSFETAEATATALADAIMHVLNASIATQGTASLVLSGGNTPIPLFKALRPQLPPIARHLTLTLTDERCVPPDHTDSNERLVREHLWVKGMDFIPLHPLPEGRRCMPPPTDATFPPPSGRGAGRGCIHLFDAVILGMGEDGHTASLFPHHPQLDEAIADHAPDIIAIHHAPKPPSERLTLSARRLMATRHLFIHITGEAKRATLEAAPQQNLPIAHFLRHPHCKVFWSAE